MYLYLRLEKSYGNLALYVPIVESKVGLGTHIGREVFNKAVWEI